GRETNRLITNMLRLQEQDRVAQGERFQHQQQRQTDLEEQFQQGWNQATKEVRAMASDIRRIDHWVGGVKESIGEIDEVVEFLTRQMTSIRGDKISLFS